MKKFLLSLGCMPFACAPARAAASKGILDAGFHTDFDDVGARAVLPAYAGECEIRGGAEMRHFRDNRVV